MPITEEHSGQTHSACDKKLKELGAKAECCYCSGHAFDDDCGLTNRPQPNIDKWLKEFDQLFSKGFEEPVSNGEQPSELVIYERVISRSRELLIRAMREYAISQLERVRHGRDDDGLFFNNVDSLIKENQI